MSLENDIRKKLTCLKPTATTIYSQNGEVHREIRNEAGKVQKIKVNTTSPGYVIDESPDLAISRVLPYLFLGSQDVAHDHTLLLSNKITHILSIGVSSPHYDDISATFVNAYDVDEFRIVDVFPKCFDIIKSVKEAGGITYVHCNAGISRSPTVVAAYLMKEMGISHTEALEVIKKTRPKIKPNPGFLKQLAGLILD